MPIAQVPQTPSAFSFGKYSPSGGGGPPFGGGVNGVQMFVSGTQFYDENSNVLQPYGVNIDGYEDSVQGTAGSPGTGASQNSFYSWSGGYFLPSIMAEWGPKVVRIMLCSSSILGVNTYDTGLSNEYIAGMTASAYLAQLDQAISYCQGIGARVIVGIRNSCPNVGGKYMLPGNGGGGQIAMLNTDTDITAWTVLATRYGCPNGTATSLSLGGIAFDFFNEPTIGNGGVNGGGISGNNAVWGSIMGTNGYANARPNGFANITLSGGGPYPANYNSGGTFYWTIAGHQQVLNAVRATGARNVCFISGPNYTNPSYGNFGGWSFLTNNPLFIPTDPLVQQGYPAQLAVSWHPYANNSATPSGPSGGDAWTQFLQLPLPGMLLEWGDYSTGNATWTNAVTNWLDTNNRGGLAWSFNSAGQPVLLGQTTSGNGSPQNAKLGNGTSDAYYAQAVYSWMSAK